MIKGMFYADEPLHLDFNEERFIEKAKQALKADGYRGIKNDKNPLFKRRFLFKENGEEKRGEIYFIDGADGDGNAYNLASGVQADPDNMFIVTNVSLLFSFHKFIWDKERGCYNLWFWKQEGLEEGYFAHVTELTQKDLREAHNIWKMWHNGAFDIYRAWENDPEA